ncbi:hypothetical protein B7494_g5121 [Chlorociboria aeruginascens]|nr:hypothetical protein B7494_g5121 [Chlorociboria aeruginascens]
MGNVGDEADASDGFQIRLNYSSHSSQADLLDDPRRRKLFRVKTIRADLNLLARLTPNNKAQRQSSPSRSRSIRTSTRATQTHEYTNSIPGLFEQNSGNMSSEKSVAEKPINPKEKLDAQIKSADMTEEMQQEAIDVAQEAMSKYSIEKDIAQHIKKTVHAPPHANHRRAGADQLKQFDDRKGATWHCIVGRNFGSFVTHETKHFIYFYLGHCAILLFKTQ